MIDAGTPWLAARARASGDDEALVLGDDAWSWRELAATAERTAGVLAGLGVGRGDIVATHVAPGPLAVALLHAAQLLGAALLPLNLRLAAAELGRVLGHAAPRVLVAGDALPAGVDTAGAVVVGVAELERKAAPRSFIAPTRVDPDAVLTVVFTSGSTAAPKGVLLSNANHAAAAVSSARRLGHDGRDTWLAAMPLFHVGGLAILVRSVLDGARVRLEPGFDAGRAADELARGDATMVPMVPTMLSRALERLRGPASARLRCVLVGGAALSPSLGARALEAGLPVSATYGMTECASQVATSVPGSADASQGRVGRPLDGVDLRIDAPDADGRGEILVRGPSVTRGYLRNAAADAAAFADGWLRTGDLGRVDERGALAVDGRRDDLVVTGGENVAPLEVEQVLDAHPAVMESLVVGVADDEWGQRVVALVALRDGLRADAADLQAWCRARLAGYKVPREFRVLRELPRGATGKILRRLDPASDPA